MHTSSQDHQQQHASETQPLTSSPTGPSPTKARVIYIGGWSDGPLRAIRAALPEGATLLEVDGLHMPPWGFSWLKNPCWVMFAILYYLLYRAALTTWGWYGPAQEYARLGLAWAILFAVGWFGSRKCLESFLWYAMCQNFYKVQALIDKLRAEDGVDIVTANVDDAPPPPPDAADVPDLIVVGYSWGAGILTYMLSRGSFTGKALMIAPATELMNTISQAYLARFHADPAKAKVIFARYDNLLVASSNTEHYYRNCQVEVHHAIAGHSMVERDATEAIERCLFAMLPPALRGGVAGNRDALRVPRKFTFRED